MPHGSCSSRAFSLMWVMIWTVTMVFLRNLMSVDVQKVSLAYAELVFRNSCLHWSTACGQTLPTQIVWEKSKAFPRHSPSIGRQHAVPIFEEPACGALHFFLQSFPDKITDMLAQMYNAFSTVLGQINMSSFLLQSRARTKTLHFSKCGNVQWVIPTLSCWFSIFSCSKSMTCRFSASLSLIPFVMRKMQKAQ